MAKTRAAALVLVAEVVAIAAAVPPLRGGFECASALQAAVATAEKAGACRSRLSETFAHLQTRLRSAAEDIPTAAPESRPLDPAAEQARGRAIRVTFEVRCETAMEEDRVLLLGNCDELGAWYCK